MVNIPKYQTYSLLDLYQVLNNVRADLYPEVYAALVEEIDRRQPESVPELEDCYVALDREKNPDYAARLLSQIKQLGGFQLARVVEVKEEDRYRTFWRRFWALFLDGFVVAIPLGIIVFALLQAGVLKPAAFVYVEQFLQVISVGYYIVMHAKYGQTVGKMAAGVKVLDKSERHGISLRQAVVRDIVPVFVCVLSIIYLIAFGAGLEDAEVSGAAAVIQYATGYAVGLWGIAELVTMMFNRKRRALHDLLARTVVVRIAA
ncbi:MAG: RDD family protein [Pseudomonadota bacterium]